MKRITLSSTFLMLTIFVFSPVYAKHKKCHAKHYAKHHTKHVKHHSGKKKSCKKNKKDKDKDKEKDKDKNKFPSFPVVGVWMSGDEKNFGDLTCNCCLKEIHYRGWLDGNIVHNFNNPYPSVVNANQNLSIIKGNDITIEGRVFDVFNNMPNLSLAELEFEKIPKKCVLGFKLDLAYGETQEILTDTMAASLGFDTAAANAVKDFRYIQHASIGYIFPIEKGLRVDFGKFVTHIGAQTIESVKNWSYSHSFCFTYAIPYQDFGFRFNYPWTDKLYTDLYLINGWNATYRDNNHAKTYALTLGWTAQTWLSFVLNYIQGPEQNDNNDNQRKLFDGQVILGPFCERWMFMINYDHAYEENAINDNTADARWYGVTGYARVKVNDYYEPCLRVEYYNDPQGFTTNVPQHLMGYTLTCNIKIFTGHKDNTLVLIRPEFRYDHSNTDFFTDRDHFRVKQDQWTVGIGLSVVI